MQKSLIEDIYLKHHERGKRYGYLFCSGARAPYLQKWIGQGKKVLDLGCRDGMLTQSFAAGNEVIGADIDRKALGLCHERLGIETVWADLNGEWPWANEQFDCIVACEIMEHLFFLDTFLKNVQQTLKKGGLFLGSVPNAFRVRNRWKFLRGLEYETDPTHVRQFSYDKLQSSLSRSFKEIEIVPIAGKILPFWPIRAGTPKRISRLFSKDLLWKCVVT